MVISEVKLNSDNVLERRKYQVFGQTQAVAVRLIFGRARSTPRVLFRREHPFGDVVAPQVSGAEIGQRHLGALTAGLAHEVGQGGAGQGGAQHDVALMHAGLGEGCDTAGAQAVRRDAGQFLAAVAGLPGAFFQDQPDTLGG